MRSWAGTTPHKSRSKTTAAVVLRLYLWALVGVEVGSRRRLVMQRRIPLLLLLLLCRLVRLRLVCWVPSIVLGAAILRSTYESR